ncbi:MAG: hypothetical protein Q9188_000630 [Gyalolechia gomerana]
MDPGQVPPEAHSHRDPIPSADPVGLSGPADSHSCVTLVLNTGASQGLLLKMEQNWKESASTEGEQQFKRLQIIVDDNETLCWLGGSLNLDPAKIRNLLPLHPPGASPPLSQPRIPHLYLSPSPPSEACVSFRQSVRERDGQSRGCEALSTRNGDVTTFRA